MDPIIRTFMLLAMLPAAQLQARTLSLSDYLDQVDRFNADLQSLGSQNRGYTLASQEPLSAFSPTLSGSYAHNETQNALQPGSPLSASDSYSSSWDLGVSKLFFTGTNVSLGYRSGWGETVTTAQAGDHDPLSAFSTAQAAALSSLLGAGQSGVWYTAAPTLEVSQNLWKGWMAKGADLAYERTSQTYANRREQNLDQAQQIYRQATEAYIQLSLARDRLKVRQATRKRAQSTLDWVRARERRNLAERTDVVASLAAVKQADLNLAEAEQGLAIAARAFNTFRRSPGAQVGEELLALEAPAEDAVQRKGERHDVKAAAHQALAEQAATAAAAESYRPDLSAFYNCTWNGGNADYAAAIRAPDHTAWAAGIRLKANIDVSLIMDVVRSSKELATGAERSLVQRREELNRDWDELQTQWRSLLERLKGAEELVALQREKMELERARFDDGRSTHAQVLAYENDYNDAQLTRLGLVAEACTLAARAKYYNGSY